jgi:hypothetical protein
LPVIFSIPANIQIRPGETVQVSLKKGTRGGGLIGLKSNGRG